MGYKAGKNAIDYVMLAIIIVTAPIWLSVKGLVLVATVLANFIDGFCDDLGQRREMQKWQKQRRRSRAW